MTISFPDAVSSQTSSTDINPGTNDLSHTVTSGTTLLLAFIAGRGNESLSGVTWNSVGMTKIIDLNASSDNVDAGGSIWGLISPTPATADFEFTSATTNWVWHIKGGVNVHGTNTDSVAAAISNLTLDENTTATNTSVHASGGTAGNWLLFFGVGIGDDMIPASNNASFNELAELNSGGGSGSGSDGSVYLADKTGVSAINVTWGATDENAGGLFEIVVGAGNTTIEVPTGPWY